MRNFGKAMLIGALALVFTAPGELPVAAQEGETRAPIPIAVGDRVYCAGFISEQPGKVDARIVGSVNEATRSFIARGERVYMNKGQAEGVQVGQIYHITRPLGKFHHPFKGTTSARLPKSQYQKKGEFLGYYTEEIGFARVLAVGDKFSTLEITETCTEARIGDALNLWEKPTLPEQRAYTPLDPLAVPNGKTNGQIIFARSSRELLSSSDVVIIDLGQQAGVKVGDYFTIYRTQGSEEIVPFRDDEVSFKRLESGSDRYRGSNYSINHPSVQKEKIDKEFPGKILPRTVVGELVVTRVEGKTANAVITRVQGTEVTLGDFVELQ